MHYDIGSMLGQRRRRCASIEPIHGQCPVFAGMPWKWNPERWRRCLRASALMQFERDVNVFELQKLMEIKMTTMWTACLLWKQYLNKISFTKRWINVTLMLGHRLRHGSNTKPTIFCHGVFCWSIISVYLLGSRTCFVSDGSTLGLRLQCYHNSNPTYRHTMGLLCFCVACAAVLDCS